MPDGEDGIVTTDSIQDLKDLIAKKPAIGVGLELSLVAAAERAKGKLDPGLYGALNWPVTLGGYYDYLTFFVTWRPIEEPESYWSNNLSGDAKGSQEIYDRLCHFYYLIDQRVPDTEITIQSDPDFAAWVDEFAKQWGAFLSSPASFSMDEVQDYVDNSPLYDVPDSMTEPGNTTAPFYPVGGDWTTFNEFFARLLRDGLRPISQAPEGQVFITRPADCTFKAHYAIGADGSVSGPAGDGVTVKGTHTYGTVGELLGDDAYNETFAGGTFAHYFLAPYSYHRFHAPVAGAIADSGVEQGQAYLAVEIGGDGQFHAPDASTDGYEFRQTRGFVVIDTSKCGGPDIGMVAAAPIGMAQVSSVILQTEDGKPLSNGEAIGQGDQFGYFYFGGSDIIVLIQSPEKMGATPTLNTNTNDPGQYSPDYYHYGTEIISLKPTG